MRIKMNTDKWLFIIGAKTNTPLWNVKQIFKTKFNSDPERLKDLEFYIQNENN